MSDIEALSTLGLILDGGAPPVPRVRRPRPARRILLHRGQDVCVNPERDLDPLMLEPLLHHLRRHIRFEQQRRAGVTQAVERDHANLGSLQETSKLALPEIIRLQREAERVFTPVEVPSLLREHRAKVMVGGPFAILSSACWRLLPQ
ncbi:MAG: hypothetical protein M3468_13235, partial [Acidobacteriota bacterium]|nr:hypothetical protein [Acidobacteriota bacterium]